MSFLANPPAPATDAEKPLANDGWFPDIDLALLRATARLDGTVTVDRLRHSATSAIASINDELAAYKAAQLAVGHARLDDVPAMRIGAQSVQVLHYLRAVYSYTQADLVERYRDFDTTGAGDKLAEKLEARSGDLRRDVRWAISDLLGIRRTTVELI